MRVKFDQFVFDSSVQSVCGPDGETLALRPQALRVLECLLTRAPDLVSKKDLMLAVWGHEAISESAIAQAIREIRKTLGDDASAPAIVGTRHGCGYQILCPVEICEPERSFSPEADPEAVRKSSKLGFGAGLHFSPIAAAVLLPVLLLAGLLSLFSWPSYMFDIGSDAPDGMPWFQVENAEARLEPPSESTKIMDLWKQARMARRQTHLASAIEKLETARQLSPESAFVHVELIQLLVEAGYPIRAAELLHDSALHTSNLEMHEHLLIQAATSRMAGKHSAAADTMQALLVYFPHHEDFLYMLFHDLVRSSATEKARQVLQQIETHVASASHDARFWLASFDLNWRTSRFSDAIVDADLALETARQQQSQALEARSLAAKARVKAFQGEYHASEALNSRAREHFDHLDDQKGLLAVWRLQATNSLARNEVSAASHAVDQVCRIQERILDAGDVAECLFLRGVLLVSQDDLVSANRLLDQAMASTELNTDPHLSGQIYLLKGQIALEQLRTNIAMERFRQAEMRFDRSGCMRGRAYAGMAFGSALVQAGNLQLARPSIVEALEVFRSIEDHPGTSDAVEWLMVIDNSEDRKGDGLALDHFNRGHRLLN